MANRHCPALPCRASKAGGHPPLAIGADGPGCGCDEVSRAGQHCPEGLHRCDVGRIRRAVHAPSSLPPTDCSQKGREAERARGERSLAGAAGEPIGCVQWRQRIVRRHKCRLPVCETHTTAPQPHSPTAPQPHSYTPALPSKSTSAPSKPNASTNMRTRVAFSCSVNQGAPGTDTMGRGAEGRRWWGCGGICSVRSARQPGSQAARQPGSQSPSAPPSQRCAASPGPSLGRWRLPLR